MLLHRVDEGAGTPLEGEPLKGSPSNAKGCLPFKAAYSNDFSISLLWLGGRESDRVGGANALAGGVSVFSLPTPSAFFLDLQGRFH